MGCLWGIERERRSKFAGLRTFGFTALLGALGGILGEHYGLLSLILLAVPVVFLNLQALRLNQNAELTTSVALFVTGFVTGDLMRTRAYIDPGGGGCHHGGLAECGSQPAGSGVAASAPVPTRVKRGTLNHSLGHSGAGPLICVVRQETFGQLNGPWGRWRPSLSGDSGISVVTCAGLTDWLVLVPARCARAGR